MGAADRRNDGDTMTGPEDTAVAPVPARSRRRRWLRWALPGGVAAVAIAIVAFGYFGVHKLFVDDVVSEDAPAFASAAQPDEAVPVISTVGSGTFMGVGRYSGGGTVTVLSDGGQRFLRFEEDFSVSNGPDLFVYLGTGSRAYGDAEQYVELGRLRGNVGSQNYEIPDTHPVTGAPIDLAEFNHVAVWCKRFDSTFAVADV